MEIKAIINRLLVGLTLVMILSYHVVTNAYIDYRLHNTEYYLLGFKVNLFLLLDIIIFILVVISLILLVMIE